MRTLGQLVGVLLLVGFVGAHFWPIALTIAAAVAAYHLTFRHLTKGDNENGATMGSDDGERR